MRAQYEGYQNDQSSGLAFIIILIIAIPLIIEFVDPTFGKYTGNTSQGLVAIPIAPPEVIPTINKQINVYIEVENPYYDGEVVNGYVCIYNTGLFNLLGNNCQSFSVNPGDTALVQFNLQSPNPGEYLNIPVTQTMVYAVYYSFQTSYTVNVSVTTPPSATSPGSSQSSSSSSSPSSTSPSVITGGGGNSESSTGNVGPVGISAYPIITPYAGEAFPLEVDIYNRGPGSMIDPSDLGINLGCSNTVSVSPAQGSSTFQLAPPFFYPVYVNEEFGKTGTYQITVSLNYCYALIGTFSINLPHIYS